MSVLTMTTTLTTCSYQRALDGLRALPGFDEGDEATVTSWENGETPAAQAAIALRRLGFKTSATTLKDHRRAECVCAVSA